MVRSAFYLFVSSGAETFLRGCRLTSATSGKTLFDPAIAKGDQRSPFRYTFEDQFGPDSGNVLA